MAADIGALERVELALGVSVRPDALEKLEANDEADSSDEIAAEVFEFRTVEEVVINLGERERGTRLPPPHTIQRRPGACE